MKEPPSIPLPPMGVRYPLYADEVDQLPLETTAEELHLPDEMGALGVGEPARPAPRRGAAWLAVALAVVLLLVIAVLGLRLLRGGHHASSAARSHPSHAGGAATLLKASAQAPSTAPPGMDTSGHATTYSAANMLDGDPTTAWRMPGDGTGATLTFTLQRRATITSLGIINGYAKTEGGMDWYAGNRRLTEVEWRFDDGRVIQQTLRDVRTLQTVQVPSIRTAAVQLRLVKVSAPGKGASGRDMTAISEVGIRGRD